MAKEDSGERLRSVKQCQWYSDSWARIIFLTYKRRVSLNSEAHICLFSPENQGHRLTAILSRAMDTVLVKDLDPSFYFDTDPDSSLPAHQ
jgi:hypothetical protein